MMVQPNQSDDYMPPLHAVLPEQETDELRLGLGLGLELGPEELPSSKVKHKLNIGEGC